MPVYEWKCEECGKEKETLQAVKDVPPSCENCLTTMKKQISLTSFQLRGSGWARDGYGR
jgi:putative FmdB family regulatory protein